MSYKERNRPLSGPFGTPVATPEDTTMIQLLSGEVWEFRGNVAITQSQKKALGRFYGYREDPNPLMDKGAYRNVVTRQAAVDGARLMAFLAPYLTPEEDPVRFVIEMLAEAGMDVAGSLDGWEDFLSEE